MAKGSALQIPKKVSPALEAVVGKGPMPTTEVIKQLWVYIKKHNLQDPNDKRTIVTDDNLKAIFDGQARIGMMKMAGYVFKQLS